MLNIEKTISENSVLKIEGRIDTTTAPELEAAVDEALTQSDTLTMDFEKVEYISSAGLRIVLKAHKELSSKGGLKLIRVPEAVMEVFEITGFLDFLTIEN